MPATPETIAGFTAASMAAPNELSTIGNVMPAGHSIDKPTAETILDYLSKSDAAMRVTQIRVLGGALAQVPADATAYAHRSQPILVNIAAFYTSEADREVRKAWASGFARTLLPNDDAAYVGFLTDDGQDRIRAVYPEATWERLRRVKSIYDPTNLFRLNQNIPPRS